MNSFGQPSLRGTPSSSATPTPSGQGRLYMWFPDLPSQAKVIGYLTKQTIVYQLAEGNCVLVDAEWERLRELAVPMRRVLTQLEADDLRVLFKLDGAALSSDDFRRVHSFTQFSRVSQSNFLHELLEQRRLTTVFQPIVNAGDTRSVFAREALLRGLARNAMVLYPAYILDLARACGMMSHVDSAARDCAVAALASGEVPERVFINISPGAAHDPVESVDTTARIIDQAGISHDRVVFEVTEVEHTMDLEMLLVILKSFRDAGFGVALDDVGSGYSSLNRLHQLRPDYLKLDMELVRDVHVDAYKALIAEKILEIARTLGIRTIAEGVEVPEELEWVRSRGADYVQGYLISRPSEPRF